jgi:hypothetical protein
MAAGYDELGAWATQTSDNLTLAAYEALDSLGSGSADRFNQRFQEAWTALLVSIARPDGLPDPVRLFLLIRQLSVDLALRTTMLANRDESTVQDWIRRDREADRVLSALDTETAQALLKRIQKDA